MNDPWNAASFISFTLSGILSSHSNLFHSNACHPIVSNCESSLNIIPVILFPLNTYCHIFFIHLGIDISHLKWFHSNARSPNVHVKLSGNTNLHVKLLLLNAYRSIVSTQFHSVNVFSFSKLNDFWNAASFISFTLSGILNSHSNLFHSNACHPITSNCESSLNIIPVILFPLNAYCHISFKELGNIMIQLIFTFVLLYHSALASIDNTGLLPIFSGIIKWFKQSSVTSPLNHFIWIPFSQ